MSAQQAFIEAVTTITAHIAGRTLDDSLQVFLDENLPPGGEAFDDQGQGWLVYEPDLAHHPTVSAGKAIVLYLLPDGAIDFTRTAR